MSFPQANILMMSPKSEISFFDFWSVDSPGFTFGMILQGTSGESITIKWGDSSQNDYVFTSGDLIITHTYAAGTFQQSWKVDKSIVTTIVARNVNITGALPLALQDFSSLVNVRLDRNDITDNLSYNNWSTKLAAWVDLVDFYLYANNISGAIGDLQSAFTTWTKIEQILWNDNAFSGSMSSVSFPASLESLELSSNSLSGSIGNIGQGSWVDLFSDDLNNNSFTGTNEHVDILFINRASYTQTSKGVTLQNNTELLTGTYQQPDLGTYPDDINDLSETQITNLAAGNDYDGSGVNVVWSILEKVWVLENLEKGAGDTDPRYGFSFTYDSAVSIVKIPNGGALGMGDYSVPNGGGAGANDWINPTAGLAEDWWNSSGTMTYSIVTGNGFAGNAQRADNASGGSAFIANDPKLPTLQLPYGVIRFKYRTDVGIQVALFIDKFDGLSSGIVAIATTQTNTGDAVSIDIPYDLTFDTDHNWVTRVRFGLVADGYLEIDEIQIISGVYDFVNPTSGLAEDWGVSGSLTPTIVTGNGFIGNAQKVVYADTTAYILSCDGFPLISGTYLVSLKIRANVMVTLRVEDESTNIELLTTIPANTGDAIEHQTTSFAFTGTGAKIYIYIANPVASDWLEIDEVEILEV